MTDSTTTDSTTTDPTPNADSDALDTRRDTTLENLDDDLPSRGLLSFYDRLRERMRSYVEDHGGRLGHATVEMLLLVPDTFVFLLRVALDPEVPKKTRILVGSALAYFVLPTDLLPEAFLGPTAFADDLVLALAVLSQAFGRELEPVAARHWSGPRKLHRVLRDVLDSAHNLLGSNVYGRLRGYLAARGIDLDAASADAASADAAH